MTSSELGNPKFKLDEKYEGLENNIWLTLFPGGSKTGLIDLGQGFPDYNPSTNIVKILEGVCNPHGNYLNHQYARPFGHNRLVAALSDLYSPLVGRKIDALNNIIVTAGAYGALYYSIMSNVGAGDEVIIIEPYFDCYESMVKLAGGVPIFIPLHPKSPLSGEVVSAGDWQLDFVEFEKCFNEKTKALVINSPNNPLGKVFSKEELMRIGDLCKKFNVLIISDEVYEWIIYDDKKHVRIASLSEDLWHRTITIGSAGKTFSLTGWKLGWAYGPDHLIQNLRVAHQNCTYMCQTPEQEALGIAFQNEISKLQTKDSYFHSMIHDLTEKRNKIVHQLQDIGMNPVVPEGGYFVYTDWSPLASHIDLSKESDPSDDFKFVKWLWREKGVLGIPPSAFYSGPHKHLAKNYIRFNFYKKEETLDKAYAILRTLKKDNQGLLDQ